MQVNLLRSHSGVVLSLSYCYESYSWMQVNVLRSQPQSGWQMKTVRGVLQRAGVDMAALLERHEVISACQQQLDKLPKPVGRSLHELCCCRHWTMYTVFCFCKAPLDFMVMMRRCIQGCAQAHADMLSLLLQPHRSSKCSLHCSRSVLVASGSAGGDNAHVVFALVLTGVDGICSQPVNKGLMACSLLQELVPRHAPSKQ